MEQAQAITKARLFADTAYRAATETIAKEAESKLIEMRENLASKGLIASSVMINETPPSHALGC